MNQLHASKKVYWALIACGSALALCFTVAAVARALSSTMTVSTTVLAVQKIRSASFPASLTITDTDAQQGAIGADSVGSLSVFANNRGGYKLQVSISSPQVASVDIIGLDGGTVTVPYPGSVIYQPWVQGSLQSYSLDFHFHLAPGTAPGTVDWPLAVNVLPL